MLFAACPPPFFDIVDVEPFSAMKKHFTPSQPLARVETNPGSYSPWHENQTCDELITTIHDHAARIPRGEPNGPTTTRLTNISATRTIV